jgi:hypothetical protein
MGTARRAPTMKSDAESPCRGTACRAQRDLIEAANMEELRSGRKLSLFFPWLGGFDN